MPTSRGILTWLNSSAAADAARSAARKLSARSLRIENLIVRGRLALHQFLRGERRNAISINDPLNAETWHPSWRPDLPFPYSATIGRDPFGEGNCLHLQWHLADWDGGRRTMAAEFSSGYFRPKDKVVYAYQVYLPSSLRELQVPLILSQMHEVPDFHLGEVWRHPISEVRFERGELSYIYRGDSARVTPVNAQGQPFYESTGHIPLGEPRYDAWNEIAVYERIEPLSKQGEVSVLYNERLHDRRNVHIGYNDAVGPYFKFGLYLPVMEGCADEVQVLFKDVSVRRARRGDRSHALELQSQLTIA